MSKLHTTLLAGVAVLALAFAATAFGGDVTQGDTSQSNGNGGTTNSGSNTSGQVSILGQTSSALSLTSVGLTGGAGGAGETVPRIRQAPAGPRRAVPVRLQRVARPTRRRPVGIRCSAWEPGTQRRPRSQMATLVPALGPGPSRMAVTPTARRGTAAMAALGAMPSSPVLQLVVTHPRVTSRSSASRAISRSRLFL